MRGTERTRRRDAEGGRAPRRPSCAPAALAGAAAGALVAAGIARWARGRPSGGSGGAASKEAEAMEPPQEKRDGQPHDAAGEAEAEGTATRPDGAAGPQETQRRLREAEAAVFDALGLSAHERCIGRHVVRGLTYREIAERIYVAERTVKYHAGRMYAKARVDNRRAFEAYVRAAIGGKPDGEKGA